MIEVMRDALSNVRKERAMLFLISTVLMVIATFLEVLSISSIIPLVGVISSGEIPIVFENLINSTFFDGSDMLTRIQKQPNIIIYLFIILTACGMTVKLLALYSTTKLTNDIGFDLTNKVYQNVLNQDYNYYVNTNSSEVIATLNKVQSLMGGVISPVLTAISSLIISIGVVCFLLVLSWEITTITFLTLAFIYLIISIIVNHTLKRNGIVISSAHSSRVKSVNEALGGIRDLILNSHQDFKYSEFLNTETKLKSSSIQNNFISAAPKYILESLGIVTLLIAAISFTSEGNANFDILPIIAAFAFALQKLLRDPKFIYCMESPVR